MVHILSARYPEIPLQIMRWQRSLQTSAPGVPVFLQIICYNGQNCYSEALCPMFSFDRGVCLQGWVDRQIHDIQTMQAFSCYLEIAHKDKP